MIKKTNGVIYIISLISLEVRFTSTTVAKADDCSVCFQFAYFYLPFELLKQTVCTKPASNRLLTQPTGSAVPFVKDLTH